MPITSGAELLLAGADIIEKRGWTRDAYARDAKGASRPPGDSGASCFCIYGALMRALVDDGLFQQDASIDRMMLHRFVDDAKDRFVKTTESLPVRFNDNAVDAAEVVAALRKAAQ